MKMAVFWVVAPCSLVKFTEVSEVLAASIFRAISDDGGSKDLSNDGKLLPDYTALQPRRQPSSYSPPLEPQILLSLVMSFISFAFIQFSYFIKRGRFIIVFCVGLSNL
jgi:hypothetical protein